MTRHNTILIITLFVSATMSGCVEFHEIPDEHNLITEPVPTVVDVIELESESVSSSQQSRTAAGCGGCGYSPKVETDVVPTPEPTVVPTPEYIPELDYIIIIDISERMNVKINENIDSTYLDYEKIIGFDMFDTISKNNRHENIGIVQFGDIPINITMNKFTEIQPNKNKNSSLNDALEITYHIGKKWSQKEIQNLVRTYVFVFSDGCGNYNDDTIEIIKKMDGVGIEITFFHIITSQSHNSTYKDLGNHGHIIKDREEIIEIMSNLP